MTVAVVTDATFEKASSQGVSITDFWAPWCGPCKMQSPVLDALAEEMTDVHFLKMDVDQNPQTPANFGVRAIPTLLLKKDGEVVDRLTGFHNKEQLAKILENYL
ncbi:thioredoxin [Convivina intestini]|uniref:Thioredoxin n=1 Tax=Convivina intestini TaxID=1505726 RepID=A0A2U1D947_9LACO|nr:thioredoxin [Convivina intestini]PVY84177.1 thioredoxin [Convivina intestini]CAH1854289.1 Thioredoxin [Convivina intestini]CAH1854665.1 Thioredoxin [Convivina intestini]SDB90955.1 thioredoxin [Leuconostocaceae bacterium R-53105]